MRRVVVPERTRRLLELLGAWGVAVGQPVLADLAADPGTFVLRRTTPAEATAFVAILLLAAPVAAWALEQLVDRLGGAATRLLHDGALALCALLWTAQLAAAAGATATVALAVGAACGAALASQLHRPVVAAVPAVLAVLVPILAAWFLVASPVADALAGAGRTVAVGGEVPGDHPDVVVIVFDELPTLSLLAPDGTIPPDRYPAFARLAATSTWYRNHTAMGPWTAYSVPSIVSSTEPRAGTLPVASQYPENLFTLLAPTYDLDVWEPEWLCPDALDCRATPQPSGSGVVGLLRDAGRLLRDRIDPPPDAPGVGPDPGAVLVGEEELALEAPAVLDGFVDSLGGGGARPRLDYLHVLAPHQPWRFLPDGRTYGAEELEGSFAGGWTDERAAEANRTRHLLQLRWADAQLGRVLDRLEARGRLDGSLVVVTADHGIAFTGGAPARASAPATLHEIYWAPLLVKLPHQAEARVDDAPVTSLDVLPTVLDAAAMPPAPGALGTSLVGGAPDRGDERRVWAGAHSELDVDGRFATIDGAAGFRALLEAAARRPLRTTLDEHRQGPHGRLVGQAAADLGLGVPLDAVVDDEARFADVDPDGPEPPGWLRAALPGTADREVVVVVNGVVAATPLARTEGDRLVVRAAIPVELLVAGANEVTIHAAPAGG